MLVPEPVENLPNIGPVLGKRLRAIGVATDEDLRMLGDAEAFRRLRHLLEDDACVHTRLALAGAVRNVRHFDLPEDVKLAVRAEVA